MGDYALGLYFFTLWADAGGANAAQVRTRAREAFGEAWITDLGKFNHGISYPTVRDKFKEMIDGGADPEMPTRAQVNTAILYAAGETPSVLSTVSSVVQEDVAAVKELALPFLGTVAVLALVGGVAYILFMTGGFKNVRKP